MGGAMVEGFAQYGTFRPADIIVSGPHMETLERLRPLGVTLTTDNKEAARQAGVVFLVVKPWLTEQVLKEIKPCLDYEKQTLAVVAAGISPNQIKDWLVRDDGLLPPTFIVMPNIAIAVGCSMSYIVPVIDDKTACGTLVSMLEKAGSTLVIEPRLLGPCIAVSCSIAYAMRYVRASTEGCVELGFKAKDAQYAVMQTVKGAIELLQHDGNNPETDIDKVTTPGGFTIRGLNAMEHAGFTSAVIKGLTAGS